MNKQEAIKSLKNIIEYWTYKPSEVEAAKLAIEALEKQIPKKPKLMEKPLAGEKFWWHCGHCGASRHTESKSNYCGYCGGKVDWSGEDE